MDFEKLGVFYLGRAYDLAAGAPSDALLLYDSKDLVTHAVCIGMTGSGKTGLGICLLEEAAIDGVPAIVIDPKGDMANLLLAFPEMRPEDFAPWINDDDARQKGLSPSDYAAEQAETWRNGLAESGQSPDRIRRMLDAADFRVYTPGSQAGIPISILRSFGAPDPRILEDDELLRERVSTTASSLLALLGIDGDPFQSREHILLSTLLTTAWRAGRDLDLAALIQQIQSPPVTRVGVMELETFFPAKDRFALAMQLNSLLAAPGFEAWLTGDPLDVGALLYTPSGKPRISIISIAHLDDAQRMFFVSLLLNEVLGWVRAQSGTTSLRALLYMDEIFGYFPPVANPPSKVPLLTLLKQARAFGLGVVLATQNPVDLDYKGLANAGTWFIGRLQTERDKARVLEGLEGAAAGQSAGFDRGRMEQTLAGLQKRVFLMHNVHEDGPVVFQVRWALSYLRGPLTRQQLKLLADQRRKEPAAAARPAAPVAAMTLSGSDPQAPAAPPSAKPSAPPSAAPAEQRPLLPPEVPQYFLPVRSGQPAASRLLYQPLLFGSAQVYFTDSKSGVELERDVAYLAPLRAGAMSVDWDEARLVELRDSDLETAPQHGAAFAVPATDVGNVKRYDAWKKSLADALFRNQRLELPCCPRLKQFARGDESERDFRMRLQQAAREERDQEVEKLRSRYAAKIITLKDRLARAVQAVQRETEQASQSKLQTAISFGATILGAFTGRKMASLSNIGKTTTAMRGVGRSMKESKDVARAAESVETARQRLTDLETELSGKVQALQAKTDVSDDAVETLTIKPKKTNIQVRLVGLAWAPHWQDPQGIATAAWE